MIHRLTVVPKRQYAVIDLTDNIRHLLKKEHIKDGACTLQALHATVGLFMAEFETNLNQDFYETFQKILPGMNFRHDQVDGNARAHLLSALYGTTVQLLIEGGHLVIGTWQHVLLAEFDNPRERHVAFMHRSL